MSLFASKNDWRPPVELPDLRRVGLISIDTETHDKRLAADLGSGWPFADGYVCGISVAYRADGDVRSHYFPLRHPDSTNMDTTQVDRWLADLIASDVRFVTQNGLYDWGWLHTDAGIAMPPAERLEEIGALAAIIDENRFNYGLDALCAWRGIPGKDTLSLEAGGAFIDLPKRANLQANIWQMPARFVGPYAEQDTASTLALFENLNPILDQEGTRDAYRLEVDLLPMVQAMRRRGIRVDTNAAEQARNLLLGKRDVALGELSEKIGANVSMDEVRRPTWLVPTFDAQGITYPRTEKGNPSFTAGAKGWMHKHPHWLPQLIARAEKYNKAGVDFLEGHILKHAVNGRIHGEIRPHRSEDGGTISLRFSYSNPPLQQMPSRDEEIAPLIRGCFLPEEGEVWAKPDISQQEFRFITHYATLLKLPRAQEAAARYLADANTDFHDLVAEMTGLPRKDAKAVNFAKAFGAGVQKFATMINKPSNEAATIYSQYDRELPFVKALAEYCARTAKTRGHIKLYDGARRHWNKFAAPGRWAEGAGPCEREEALRRIKDTDHPWFGKSPLWRVDTHKAMNALIQGSAARHTKLWMRAVWREGITPLLQMHDCLDLSVSSPEQAELVAQLGREAVKLEVPIEVDLKFGRTWGDATHTWSDLTNVNGHTVRVVAPVAAEISDAAAAAEPKQAETRHARDDYASGEERTGRPLDRYIYYTEAGEQHHRKTRSSTKKFWQDKWERGRWVTGAPKIKFLYGLRELLAAPPDETVWITEGEKDANTLAALSLMAVTNPGGAGKWTTDFAPEQTERWFKGRRKVYVLEDNDAPGRNHVDRVAKSLLGLVGDIRIVRFRELEEKDDVTDWLELGHTKQELLARAEAAPQWEPDGIDAIRATDVEMRELTWVWPGRFAVGKIGLLAGLPDEGKGQVLFYIAAQITNGGEWPCNEGPAPKGGVILLTAEDDLHDTVVPRLAAAGADLNNVHIIKMVKTSGAGERMFSLVDDLELLRRKIAAIGDVVMVQIDPMSAYLGVKKIDSFRTTDVRAVLAPLVQLASELKISVLGILHFNKKLDVTNALLRISDSLAFGATARHVARPQIAGERQKQSGTPGAESTGVHVRGEGGGQRSRHRQRNTGTLHRVAARLRRGDRHRGNGRGEREQIPSAREDAKSFLLDFLGNGPKPKEEVEDARKAFGIADRTLRRAKEELRVRIYRKGGFAEKGGWLWELPPTTTEAP